MPVHMCDEGGVLASLIGFDAGSGAAAGQPGTGVVDLSVRVGPAEDRKEAVGPGPPAARSVEPGAWRSVARESLTQKCGLC